MKTPPDHGRRHRRRTARQSAAPVRRTCRAGRPVLCTWAICRAQVEKSSAGSRPRYGSHQMTAVPEVVVVTGASAGLGRAIVQRFAREKAHIGLIARGEDGLQAARQEVEAAGGKALVL
ncbi:MAG TPA: SDR family NAD(P)-dependent oxidoreductase, partial [Bryobacteraceae bacterium]